MFPCGTKHFVYDPNVKYCKRNGYTAYCDPSMCLMEKNTWERQACGLYCGDIKKWTLQLNDTEVDFTGEVKADETFPVWETVSGVSICLVVILSVVIVYMWFKNCNKNPSPAIVNASAPPVTNDKDQDETHVLLVDGESSTSEADSAVGSDVSRTTVNGPSSFHSSPQNNHVDPHTQRNDKAGLAVTGIAQNFGAPCGVETTDEVS
ncbi:uncharacterized protein LOC110443891 [Mizuhopecten yessoensis]|uniref:Uncharacterized protein n=1 Tax=Mizuhopecten yessoensis TaxID=6573 RepID=A0A210PDU9_MIZYE|nr:uncharacterized protein LOC110443891 [Mizuhopecten yessoensis]XP_021344015.1 uncharacterized protein LOC110443891 [Mizuhopecten yessoensis]OWF34680.1 hypothetical protein KP79_PYT11449 [Mizuhopecten yessoensis]